MLLESETLFACYIFVTYLEWQPDKYSKFHACNELTILDINRYIIWYI